MTNVKAQIPNECQMTNAKTNNHESTKVEKICEPSFDIHNSLFDIRYLSAVIMAGSFFELLEPSF
jgi:hypothetical protein